MNVSFGLDRLQRVHFLLKALEVQRNRRGDKLDGEVDFYDHVVYCKGLISIYASACNAVSWVVVNGFLCENKGVSLPEVI